MVDIYLIMIRSSDNDLFVVGTSYYIIEKWSLMNLALFKVF